MGGRPANTVEELWSKVDKQGPHDCWLWKGFRNYQGYGRTWINDRGYYAHRVIYALATNGSIEPAAPANRRAFGYLMHTCDNPPCCNPSHLRACTQAENVQDKVRKGRAKQWRSTESPNALLSEDDVRWIRLTHARGWATIRAQALLYGVSKTVISHLLYGRTYQDVK